MQTATVQKFPLIDNGRPIFDTRAKLKVRTVESVGQIIRMPVKIPTNSRGSNGSTGTAISIEGK